MRRNLKELINILERMRDDGINEVDGEEFDTAVRTSIDIFTLIEKYVQKHGDIALCCGAEWMYQDDDGQIDGLELCGDILDSLNEYAEYEENEE
jgi:hypothetical protein